MIKVLHIIDSEGLYGAEIVLLYLMREQKKQGMFPILGSIGKPGISEKDIEVTAKQSNIIVKRFCMKNGPNLFGAVSIINFAKQQNVDVIHCHGYKANILTGILPERFRRIPYIVTFHGWTSIKKFSRMWLYGWLDAIFAKRADMTVVVSDSMLSHSQILSTGLTPLTVHNGIPKMLECKGEITDMLNGLCSKGFTLLAIGRLSPEKGFDFLIKAVANVINNGYDVSLVIIGEGNERQKLEGLASEKGIANKVLFTGYLEGANKYLHYFDLFVISSLTEGLPITLLEAMQACIPIVATQVGGIPEALDNGRCGILVNTKDEHGLSKAIAEVHDLSDEEKKQRCLAAKKHFENEFSSEKMELGYRKVYEKLLHT